MNRGIGIQGNMFSLGFVLSLPHTSEKQDFFFLDNPIVLFCLGEQLMTCLQVLVC